MLDWRKVFEDAAWFHWTGITPAISEGAAKVCMEAVQAARDMGVTISCDMNYRAKLWKWGKTAGEVMSQLVENSDVAIGNEEDAEKVFGIKAPESDITAGKVSSEQYAYVCEIAADSQAETMAITLRGSISAGHSTWAPSVAGRRLCSAGVTSHCRSRRRDDFHGRLIGLTFVDIPEALDFAVAASISSTVFSDFNLTVGEAENPAGVMFRPSQSLSCIERIQMAQYSD
jgi:2-dehydro-3-deoxygluconokinase